MGCNQGDYRKNKITKENIPKTIKIIDGHETFDQKKCLIKTKAVCKKQTDMETITCGVSQCSILGPLLFLLFFNRLHKAVDTNLFVF